MRMRCRQQPNTLAITAMIVSLSTLMIALSSAAQAEPYMALREGYACGDCHTNRSGGGMRNLTVQRHGADIMHVANQGDGVLGKVDERFSPRISDFLSVGADFRVVDRLLFQDNPDTDGRVKNNTAFRDLESNDIDVDQATLYAELRLIPDRLSFYIDERVAPGGADNREIFALVDGMLPFGAYIKAGQFFAPWGLKIQDRAAFVSSQSGLNFDNNVAGVEIGRSGGGLSWFVSVSENTEDNDADQLLTASASYMWTDSGPFKSIMIGGSAAHDAPGDSEVGSYTAFGGFALGPLSVLAQAVLLDTEVASVSNQAWAIYGEANWLVANWINAKIAFDWFDPDDEVSEDHRNRVSIGLEPFLDEYLQLRLFYRVFNGPENQLDKNRDELTLEAHLFF